MALALTTICLSSEIDYIERFCEIYKDEIITPDGFRIICKYPKETAKHFCRGGDKKQFQAGRAYRIEWGKDILLNPKERKVLLDNKTNNLIFFYENGRVAYAVICSPQKNGQLNLVSGFIVGGRRTIDYREGKPPYSFYEIKKSC